MAIIRSIIFYPIVLLSFLVGTALTLIALIFQPGTKSFRRSARIWAKFLLFVSGTSVKIEGLENVPKDEPLVFVSNHQSAADILILLATIPRYFRFVIKKELFGIPIFGAYLRWSGYMPLDRGAGAAAVKSLSKAENYLKDNGSILIFPEGTRSGSHEMKKFRRGSLFLIFNTKTRVVPIALDGSYKLISRGGITINPTPVKVSFGKPLSFEGYKREKDDYEKAIGELETSIKKML